MQALITSKTGPIEHAASAIFRQRFASALMHSVTLASLGVLLINDLVFKALWPGAWVPGKLSDLAWMILAPPVLAYILSFATLGSRQAQRAVFVSAYIGLPLLYVAFNTFDPVHDVILHALGWFGGDGPRSPLDPTDSIVVPFAMLASVWVWRRPPLPAEGMRARLTLLTATVAGLATVATSYPSDWGIRDLGRTASGTLGAHTGTGFYESVDGGMNWTKTGRDSVPLENRRLMELGLKEPSGIFSEGYYGFRIANRELFISGESVYSFGHLQSGGNRWMQALDKREIVDRAIATRPYDYFYDSQSGNLILAMGLQGVVVITPWGTTTQVAVGPYSPTEFSFWSKTHTFFNSLASWEIAIYAIGPSIMLAFSFSALALALAGFSTPALAGSLAPICGRCAIAVAAAISTFYALSIGIYPRAAEYPWEADGIRSIVLFLALVTSGLGLFPLLLTVVGLKLGRPSRRQLLAVAASSIGMLVLILIGAPVLFQTGPLIANFVAVGLVGSAALGLWTYQKHQRVG